MKEALLVIDYTIDFVAEDGKLTCGLPGQQLERYIVDTTKDFIEREQFVVIPNDVHEENDPFHPETALFPPHNIRGTEGRHLFGELQSLYEANKERVIWMDKTRYSAFAGTNLDILLRERNIRTVHLMGVCTDICILHTAIDAYNLGYDIVVHTGGVASFDMEAHQFALKHFKNVLNAKVIE
ncbi:MAG TPA: isochorismatase family cysteine hydrolase [Savagea sp.]